MYCNPSLGAELNNLHIKAVHNEIATMVLFIVKTTGFSLTLISARDTCKINQ